MPRPICFSARAGALYSRHLGRGFVSEPGSPALLLFYLRVKPTLLASLCRPRRPRHKFSESNTSPELMRVVWNVCQSSGSGAFGVKVEDPPTCPGLSDKVCRELWLHTSQELKTTGSALSFLGEFSPEACHAKSAFACEIMPPFTAQQGISLANHVGFTFSPPSFHIPALWLN